jgi:hypothetical protein
MAGGPLTKQARPSAKLANYRSLRDAPDRDAT